MRIGIDCRKILNPEAGEQAGIAHYTYYLVKNFIDLDKENTYVLFFDDRILNTKEFEQKNVEIRMFPYYQYKRYLPFTYSHMIISAKIAKEKLDLFHSPLNTLPMMYSGKSVVTIHDLAIYDHPKWFPSKFLPTQSFSTKVLVPKSIQQAKKVIAVSENTKKDLIRLFQTPEDKIKVVYEGVVPEKRILDANAKKLLDNRGIAPRYVLFLGTIEPRKNIVRIIEAYKEVLLKHPDWTDQLVLAGGKGWNNEAVYYTLREVKRALSKGRQHDPVLHIGTVTHEEKLALMQNAQCFVWPSLYEGFGLPLLEALNFGTPVVTSNTSSIPEVVGDAAIKVHPMKVKEIEDAITKVIDPSEAGQKLRKQMHDKGIEQAKKFSWEKTAQETLKVYEEIGR